MVTQNSISTGAWGKVIHQRLLPSNHIYTHRDTLVHAHTHTHNIMHTHFHTQTHVHNTQALPNSHLPNNLQLQTFQQATLHVFQTIVFKWVIAKAALQQ